MGTTLTGVFAPGSPLLHESLHTLAVEPKRPVAPGEAVRVQFSVSNFGGAAATGLRARFAQPPGVTHVAGEDTIDDRPLDEGASFVDAGGAPAGDLDPDRQRVFACSFRIDETIEDGSELIFQAALIGDETPLVATNRERVVVRSRPNLDHAGTSVTLTAPDHPRPGDTIVVRATIANAGASSAHDVALSLPVPRHTTYVPRSARVDGRALRPADGEPFDYANAVVVSERLTPGQSVTAEYHATIDSPLADATSIKAAGSTGSRECAEFALVSNEIVAASPADFSGEETALTILCDDAVEPGTRVAISLRAVNAGTGPAESAILAFALPPGLAYAPGSATLDGQPIPDASIPDLAFSVGTLAAGAIAEAAIGATVVVPHRLEEPALPVEASLRWRGGDRSFARRLTLRTAPRFNRARNFVRPKVDVVHAREEIRYAVHLFNDGTAPEREVRLRLLPGVHLENVRVTESSRKPSPYREPLALGTIAPHVERVVTVVARVATRVPDRSSATLGAVLEYPGGVIDLGTASVLVRSRPQLVADGVAWEIASSEPLRPNRFADLVVRLTNSGSDALRDARLVLKLPEALGIERAIDARRARDGVHFGEIPAQSSHRARITLRLLHPVPSNRPLAIEGWIGGNGIAAVQLPPLELPVYAQPDFADARLLAAPSESVAAGDRIAYELRVRNDGDGAAERLVVRAVPTDRAVYVPASTTINGVELEDDGGTSPLWSQRGLVLADVDPGAELQIRWEMSVIAPARAGTTLETRAVLEWGEHQTLALSAPVVAVQARPALGETTFGTPFSVARAIAPEAVPPPAVQPFDPGNREALDASHTPALALPRAIAEVIAQLPPPAAAPVLYADFPPERLAHTLKMIERSRAGGAIVHLFALRMLAPQAAFASPAAVSAAFASANRALRAPLERFFVRLRMPRLSIAAKDLEDEASRAALRDLLDALGSAETSAVEKPAANAVRIEGALDAAALPALKARLDVSPLGSAVPWVANAQLLGTTVRRGGERIEAFAGYRDAVIERFSQWAESPVDEFHRALATSSDERLDALLAGALRELHAGAELTPSY